MTLTVLAGSANVPLADAIATELSVTPQPCVVQRFEDTELHVLIEETVRGHDVYLVQPTSPPVDEHIVELLFLADACRRAGARRLTAVTPYFGYARQDRRAVGREPIGARVVAELIEAAGFDRVIAIDLHTPAIEGFFHLPIEHLSAASILAEAVRPVIASHSVVVAPDMGAAKLAERYRDLLNLPMVVLRKARLSGHEVSLRGMIGDGVKERAPLIVDDMITTGATIEAAVKGLLAAGCLPEITVAATHALFVGPAAVPDPDRERGADDRQDDCPTTSRPGLTVTANGWHHVCRQRSTCIFETLLQQGSKFGTARAEILAQSPHGTPKDSLRVDAAR